MKVIKIPFFQVFGLRGKIVWLGENEGFVYAREVKLLLLIHLLFAQISWADAKLQAHIDKIEQGGLQEIIKKRYLRVLTTKNAYDYYIYQGSRKGIQYEMVREFTKHLNKKYTKKGELPITFELIPVDFDQLVPMLTSGKGDFIAVGLTKTPNREQLINFTEPYQVVNDVVVTRKELKQQAWREKTFHVQAGSSYQKTLTKQKIKTESIDSNFNPADVLELISLKKYDYTLVNSFWAKTLSKLFTNLTIIKDQSFRKRVPISWGVNKKHKKILSELNKFLPKVKKGTLLGNIFNYKYFYNMGRIRAVNSNFKENKISNYDDLFRKYAKKFNLDWRLLAAVSYQESRFDQSIVNKWGAIGMMQIKQMTANEPYINIKKVKGLKNRENNVHAGSKYLAWIKKLYFDWNEKMDEKDRLRMTLASYNAGPRRVQQARSKAKKMGLNPNIWFRNVELAMLKRGYPEPVIYVSEINKHFVSYVLLGIE